MTKPETQTGGATDVTHKCDWPGCEAKTESWLSDGWATCGSHEDVAFLPDPCLLCPAHGLAYEDLACNVQPPTPAEH